jgi:hypothetical protein
MILKDKQIELDGLFNYFNDLDPDKFDICQIYRIIIESLVDNIENRSLFKFHLPLNDKDVWIELEDKENILKVLDYIIGHFYTFEIYELIRDFKEIRKYYEEIYEIGG